MKNLIIKIIKSIPIIGNWKIISEKYFALHAEPDNYNSPIGTWDGVAAFDSKKIINSRIQIF